MQCEFGSVGGDINTRKTFSRQGSGPFILVHELKQNILPDTAYFSDLFHYMQHFFLVNPNNYRYKTFLEEFIDSEL